jgi:hypothetical protein
VHPAFARPGMGANTEQIGQRIADRVSAEATS